MYVCATGTYIIHFGAVCLMYVVQQVRRLTAGTVSGCAPLCARQNFTLAMISATYGQCMCSNIVPLASQELPYTDCLAGKSGFAVFYQHAGDI
jgi:hypothetical protein